MKVLVAGATGVVGRELLPRLTDCVELRALSRRGTPSGPPGGTPRAVEWVRADVTRPASLRGACDGAEVVVSCVGASLDPRRIGDRAGYARVDHLGNVALLEEARRAGVRRFVYVSVFATPPLAGLEYVAAHDRFADALAASGLERVVARPTGLFAFLADLLPMARRGRGVLVGDGAARTNPVHEADLAAALAAAVTDAEPAAVIDVGGPDVLSRREIAQLALRAAGRPDGRLTRVSPAALRLASRALRPVNPRVAALLRFATEVSLHDVVAPAAGRRRLADYLAERA